MKKIINNKLYDTSTAKRIGSDGYNGSTSDFGWWQESLYKKRTGEFFLHGEGGPRTRYAKSCGDNSWGYGAAIIPMSYEKAREWAEEHMEADDYAATFGIPEEGTERLYVEIPSELMARIKAAASANRQSLKDYMIEILSK